MHKNDLFKLLETDEVKSNPVLHTELYKAWNNIYSDIDIRELSINACEFLLDHGLDSSKALSSVLNGGYYYSDPISKETLHQIELAKFLIEKGASFKDVYYVPSSFPTETYQYLLDHGMDASCLIRSLRDISGERHDQVLEMVVSIDIDWNKVSVSYSTSLADLEKFLELGLDPSKALSSVLNGGYSYSESISKETLNQIELAKFLIEKGASFKDVYHVPSSFPTETYQYLLDHGMDASCLIRNLSYFSGERHDQVLEMVVSIDIDWNKVSVSYSTSLADLEKFLELGLDPSKALSSVLNGGYSYSDPISKETLNQIELAKFLIEKGASFKDVYYVPSSFPTETYQYLLDHGMDASCLIRSLRDISGERHDQVLEMVVSRDIDWNKVSVSYSTSLADLEKFLELGLDPSKALSSVLNGGYSYSDPISKETLNQIELAKFLIEKGASFKDVYYVPSSFPTETYQYLLDHGMDASCLIRSLRDISGERHDQVLEMVVSRDIDWNKVSVSYSTSLADLEKFLENGLGADIVLVSLLNGLLQPYDSSSEKYNTASLSDEQKNILDLAIEKGEDLNKIFEESFSGGGRISMDGGVMLQYIIPESILKVFLSDYSLAPKLLLAYSAANNLSNLLDFVLENYSDLEISLEDYITCGMQASFENSIKIIESFSNVWNDEEFYEYARAQGSSDSLSRSVIDNHNLFVDYIAAKNGKDSSLSLDEIKILAGEVIIDSAESYNNIELKNNYRYTPLHIALIAGRYDIALKMIEFGADIYAKANHNITALHLLDGDSGEDERQFIQKLSKTLDRVDLDLGDGQSLVDVLITNRELQDETIEKSEDPLYSLFKENADLFLPSQNISKTSIAISHGDGFWSSGIWSTSRLLVTNHPEVQFYLVDHDMVEKGGEAFIKQFDAVINPGAGDTFPKKDEFSKEDCSFNMELEQHYQDMLNQTDAFHIPYLGMCAGAQHFSLYHGGKLKTVEGYNQGHHNMTFIKGTLPYFMSLNKDQQEKALSSCEFPEVNFKGDTAHHYAAVTDNLGEGMQLGAVSEDGIAMAYMHSNIRFATQFHPEHYYGREFSNINHQAIWLDNFVDMAVMHHEYRVNGGVHPMEYYANVQEKLSGCMSMQEVVVLSGDDISSL